MKPTKRDSGAPERLALLPLLALILLFPPEVHGLTLAGGSVLILLVALVAWWRGWTRGWPALAAAVVLLAPFVLLAPAPALAAPPVAMFVLAAALALVGASASDSGRTVASTVAATATAMALYGLWQRTVGLAALSERIAAGGVLPDQADLLERAEAGRAFGTLTTPAAFGGLLALALPSTVGLALTLRGRLRAVWLGAAALQLAGIVASASATAALALMAAIALGWVLATVSRAPAGRRMFAIGAVMLVAVVSAIVAIRGPQVLDAGNPDSPVRLRAGNFRSAGAMVADHPWLGVGPGGFAEVYPAYRLEGDNETRHVHNLPLELMAETGFVAGGLLAAGFLGVFALPLVRLTRSRARDAPPWCRGVAVGLAAFAIHNLGDYTAWMPSVLWVAAALLGAVLGHTALPARAAALDRRFSTATVTGLAVVAVAAAVSLSTGIARDARFEARLAAWHGDDAVAERRALEATAWAPWDPDAALFLTRATLGTHETALPEARRRLALERAERAVALVPMRAAARRARARARILLGDAAGAYADLAEAARLYPLHEGYAGERDGVAARLNELAALAGAEAAE